MVVGQLRVFVSFALDLFAHFYLLHIAERWGGVVVNRGPHYDGVLLILAGNVNKLTRFYGQVFFPTQTSEPPGINDPWEQHYDGGEQKNRSK